MPEIFVAPKENHQASVEKKHTTNPLAAFAAYPDGVHFATQEEKEEIVLLLRRHIITNFFWVVGSLLMIIAPFAILPFFKFLLPINIPLNFQLVAILIWYSLVASFVFINFLSWYFNVYIVTNKRIVDVDFYNLIYKQISHAPLERVQDITIKAGGVIRTFFDFADVFIQTAGTEPNFEFEAVPKPDIVVRKINELIHKKEK